MIRRATSWARGRAHFEPRGALRRLVFGNLWMTLALLLGASQALLVHWLIAVVLGDAQLGAVGLLGLQGTFAAANLATLPALRRARLGGSRGRRVVGLYMTTCFCTLLLGGVVALSWLGLLPLRWLFVGLGLGDAAAFDTFRTLSLVGVAGVALAVGWALTGGRRITDRGLVRVIVDGLPAAHRGLRVLHLSDFHIGNDLEGDRLDRVVADANARAADLIVLTGDLFDFDPAVVDDGARRLGGLRARLGVYAVLGNHDIHTGADVVAAGLARHAPAIRLLRDAVVRLPLDPPLYLAGVDDPGVDWASRSVHIEALDSLAARRPDDGPALLLVHRPQAFAQAASLGFPLVLSGHTHGGQLALPFRCGRDLNLARAMTDYTRGLYELHGSKLYVSRGVGVAGPAMRFNCRREMTTLELV
jgi:hypothetical protein